ncbi:MAG: NAD-dependent protein deacylase [Promethearchaeota archaeon]
MPGKKTSNKSQLSEKNDGEEPSVYILNDLNDIAEDITDKMLTDTAKTILSAKNLVVLTGAGISTESGIPDFRSPNTGLWSKISPEESKNILKDPKMFWKLARELGPAILKAKPNKAHEMLAWLDKINVLKCLITQNIDGLHQKAGNLLVQELHGNATEMKCTACHGRFSIKEILKNHKVEDDKYPPSCPLCGGYLVLNVVFFDQLLPRGVWLESVSQSQIADVFLVIGSSLVVQPANQLPLYALKNNAKLIIINNTPTDFDKKAYIILRGKASEISSRLLKIMKSMYKNGGLPQDTGDSSSYDMSQGQVKNRKIKKIKKNKKKKKEKFKKIKFK